MPEDKKKAKGASLLIVESPAKGRTISRFLGKDFIIKSSYGHVRDLPPKGLGVDEKKDFAPTYVMLPRAKKILPELKSLMRNCRTLFLATDHDREGESIAWHLVELLKPPSSKVKRITFHEITPEAIREALESPRDLDFSLVDAQQARRVLDRLVGYKLSPLLWQKVRKGLSAGRVQSVTVRLLVERKFEIEKFVSESYWSLTAVLEKEGHPQRFEARLVRYQGRPVESSREFPLFADAYRVRLTCFTAEEQIRQVLENLKAKTPKVLSVDSREVRRRPQPPFTTSTLQQEASRKLGFSSERTMRVAQSLYEGVELDKGEAVGLITYMRTDSVSVAPAAQKEARKWILASLGSPYAPEEVPVYQTKSRMAQEAHEAIRPTGAGRVPEEIRKFLNPDQNKVYELIWRRFVASQMTEAVYQAVSCEIEIGEGVFSASGRTLKFDGFLRVYQQAEAEDKNGEETLPPLSAEDPLRLLELAPKEHSTSPPPYYNEASLIRALEKNGIGRPSTYAPTIKTIVDRGYVRAEARERRLLATDLGVLVTEKLKAFFPEVVNLSYTAEVEERLDRIAEGKDSWQNVVRDFYAPFSKAMKQAQQKMEKTAFQPEVSSEKCPKCGHPMWIRESRYGKYLSCSQFPKCKGKIPLNSKGERQLPQETGEKCDLCGKPMVIRFGRRGRFLACTGYPACKNTYSLNEKGEKIAGSRPIVTDQKCPKCGSALWLRFGKRGAFLACSGYPKCRHLVPVGKEEAEKYRK